MRVEAHLQPLAGALHLFEDPLTRGADAAGGGVGAGERVARAEAHELFEELAHPLFGDVGEQRGDARVGVGRARHGRGGCGVARLLAR